MEGKYFVEFVIKELPPTLNALGNMHYLTKARSTRKWQDLAICGVGENRPPKPLTKAKICITRHSSQEGDGDNYSGGYKPLIDGLRHARVIQDDRMSNIGNIETRWVKAPRGKGFITVRIEEV